MTDNNSQSTPELEGLRLSELEAGDILQNAIVIVDEQLVFRPIEVANAQLEAIRPLVNALKAEVKAERAKTLREVGEWMERHVVKSGRVSDKMTLFAINTDELAQLKGKLPEGKDE